MAKRMSSRDFFFFFYFLRRRLWQILGLRELDVVGEEEEDLGLRWIEAGNDDDDGGENGGLVELVGLVLWWAGDKEMMVLGVRCGLVARRRG